VLFHDVLQLDRMSNGRNSSAVTPALSLNVTISMRASCGRQGFAVHHAVVMPPLEIKVFFLR